MSEYKIHNYTESDYICFDTHSDANDYIKGHPNDKLVLYKVCKDIETEIYSQAWNCSTNPDYAKDVSELKGPKILCKDKVWFALYVYFPSRMNAEGRFEYMSEMINSTALQLDDSVMLFCLERNTDEPKIWQELVCVYSPTDYIEGKHDAFFEEAMEYMRKYNKEHENVDEQ